VAALSGRVAPCVVTNDDENSACRVQQVSRGDDVPEAAATAVLISGRGASTHRFVNATAAALLVARCSIVGCL